ncbi:phage major capsid protein [Clostridium botulinum]|uniref:phage major capsid protein n=1 Tax=unclassified Clostridium TaxID=2614128 RepID=UPI0013CA0B9D|nr:MULTISPECIES: phage major capsid protein [unclassified Clostridium]NFH99470.1 phage major capsid protein [Clostridium botulinum]NFI62195.1 phage major capsid protein [Clostridium botulinum]NFJ42599.1 phage major capsid protein [Clostridium botulinum]NFJ46530.1 phage major capsid protein [Clostridium botulinum]NFK26428.1 phage major capsid protein [Clostridium botulinum]
MKELMEKRNNLITEMEGLVNKAKQETRAFDETETNRVEEIKKEIRSIDVTIKTEEEMRSFEKIEEERKDDEEVEKRNLGKELMEGKTLNLNEVRAVTENVATSGNVAVGKEVVGQSWADTILRNVEYVSPLYGMANKIVTTQPHNIALQGNKIGKFVKTGELADYVAQNANFKSKQLGAVKYTNMFTISKELIQDSMYDVEGELKAQTAEALGQTLDEMIIKGDSSENVEGLEMLSKAREITAGGVKKVSENDLLNMFYAVKPRYRQNAVWILSDATCRELAKLKDTQGRPLLTQSYNVAPIGSKDTAGVTTFLLGKPVIVNDFVPAIDSDKAEKSIYFGDFNKVMTIGIRKNLEVERSTEFGFLNDSIAVKSSIRLDAKIIDEEAMVCLKSKIA